MIQAVESAIQIENVGAVKLVDIPLKPGTIVTLIGDNGAGKSTAITAVTSAISGENAGLKPSDGKKAGKIRMPGATISVGARIKRTDTGDEARSFVVVEDGTGISKILKPGLKDVKAADKKRLEGVLDVIGATLPIEKQREFLGDHYPGFAASREVDGGFVDTVKSMKLYLESVARTHTMKLDEFNGAIHQIGEVPDDTVHGESVESLAARMASLTIELRDALQGRRSADSALLALAAVVDAKPVADLESGIAKTREFIRVTEEKIRDLQESLSEAKLILVKDQATADAQRAADSQRETLRKAIDTAPTAEVIAEKTQVLSEVTALHRAAVIAGGDNDRLASQRKQLAELKSKREFTEATRDSIKDTIHRLPELLHEALSSVPGWTVDEELRLCVEHRRGQIPFSELSPGEGTARVCLLACQFAAYESDDIPVVGLPQECWEGLDGKNRRLLLDSVRQHGLCIVSAQASGEDEEIEGIRVKVLS